MMLKKLTIPFLVTLLLVACQPNPAPVKLSISSQVPAADAVNVPVDAVVAVTFNVAIRVPTLSDNFTVAQGETAVDGMVTYDPDTRTATFTPEAPLAIATVYTVTVGADVESGQSVRLGADYQWTFTTASSTTLPTVTSVTITGGDFSLLLGATQTLAAEVVVTEGADDTVAWTSSDEDIATVDDAGEVLAVAVGTATITATSTVEATMSDSVEVTVVATQSVTAVAINEVDPATTIGGTVPLTATVTAVAGADEAVTWTSADDSIATVDTDGVVTGVSAGTVGITATSNFDGAISDTVDVEVAPALAFGDDYADSTGQASIFNSVTLAAPTPTSVGYGALTYEITDGALPPGFTVDNGTSPLTFELELDPATGEISGATGWPGTFTGTVTATDELGQTADIDFNIDRTLLLEVYNSEGTDLQTTFRYSNLDETVVPGDRIRVSGVSNSEWLPTEFSDALEFSLEYVSVTSPPPPPGEPYDDAFDVNTGDGTVSLGTALDYQSWTFNLVLDYDGSDSTSVTLRLVGFAFPPA